MVEAPNTACDIAVRLDYEDMKLNYLGDIPIDMAIVKSGELNTPFMLKESSEKSYKAFKNIINNIINETK